MFRVVFTILTGVLGAALLHVIIILSLPHFSDRDAYTRVEDEGDVGVVESTATNVGRLTKNTAPAGSCQAR